VTVEQTLILVKPDGVQRGLIGEVIRRIERKGFTIQALELRSLDRDTAEQHYGEHVDKPFFGDLVEFITSGPLVALCVEGPDAVGAVRTLMGPTNPIAAPPGSIRGDYGLEIEKNLVHGSDSAASAARELALFFPRL
jgi:nucleoside-diphosphate kinase